ncbi:MAG: hypothetical protein WDM80_07010 [Limisphaerales bacterium]
MKRIILTGILGAVITFAWSAVVHMNPLTGMMGLSMLNEKEDVVMAAVRDQVPQPGLYYFPGIDMSKSITPEQEAAWTAKYKIGPSGLLLVQPKGDNPMPPSMLIIEFVSTLGCALIAAFILTSTVGSFVRRVAIVMMLGLFSWLAISVSQWNWYAFPFAFVTLDAIDQVFGWLLAGLVMAKLIKPARLPDPAAA